MTPEIPKNMKQQGRYMKILTMKCMRSAVLILIMAAAMSTVLFYYEEDINYAVSGLAAPALKKLVYSQTKTGYKAVLSWKAKKGRVYQVLRKTSGSGKYKVLAKVKATSATGKYTDTTIGKNKAYTYTVRRVIMSGSKVKQSGKYDSEGLTTIAAPTVKVDFTNRKADVSWKKVSGVSKYLVQRRVGKSDKFYNIKSLSSGKKSYSDYYYYSTYDQKNKAYSKKLASLISVRLRSHFLDASNNPLSYKVQGYYSRTVNLVKKESYGLTTSDGEFGLEAPTIVSLTDSGLLTWGTVANTDWYRIYSSTDGENWTKIADLDHTGSDYIPPEGATDQQIYQRYQIPEFDRSLYYTVRAYANKNGSTVKSSYDTGFTIKNRNYSEKILLVGDSISFGSPYYEGERRYFSFRNRIEQLTGASFFNPSIPGATYHHGVKDSAEDAEEDTDDSTSKLVTGLVQMMVENAYDGSGIHIHHNTDKITTTLVGSNKTYLYDYDVVMLAGGTNDYLHYDKNTFKFGSSEIDWEKIKDSDKTRDLTFTVNSGTNAAEKFTGQSYDYNINTFNGAYNQMLKWIEEASIYRVQHGKKPIQVVAMSMFYSDRTNATVNGVKHYPKTNRNITPNSLGYTLTDYQKQLNDLNSKWQNVAAFDLYPYDTQGVGILDESTCPYRTADNIHLTKFTYGQYGNSLSSFMMGCCLGDKIKDIDVNSQAFIARAAKYSMLSERLTYLENEASGNTEIKNASPDAVLGLQSVDGEEDFDDDALGEEEPDPAVEEMKSYIRLLYEYGYLDQMLDECSPEDRERYERFIEYYDLLGEKQEEEEEDAEGSDDPEADENIDDDPEQDPYIPEDDQEGSADGDTADGDYLLEDGTDSLDTGSAGQDEGTVSDGSTGQIDGSYDRS